MLTGSDRDLRPSEYGRAFREVKLVSKKPEAHNPKLTFLLIGAWAVAPEAGLGSVSRVKMWQNSKYLSNVLRPGVVEGSRRDKAGGNLGA